MNGDFIPLICASADRDQDINLHGSPTLGELHAAVLEALFGDNPVPADTPLAVERSLDTTWDGIGFLRPPKAPEALTPLEVLDELIVSASWGGPPSPRELAVIREVRTRLDRLAELEKERDAEPESLDDKMAAAQPALSRTHDHGYDGPTCKVRTVVLGGLQFTRGECLNDDGSSLL